MIVGGELGLMASDVTFSFLIEFSGFYVSKNIFFRFLINSLVTSITYNPFNQTCLSQPSTASNSSLALNPSDVHSHLYTT